MATAKNIGIVLSEKDKGIIAWLNMLNKAGMSPRTWVQAVLLADFLRQDIDVGVVYVSDLISKRPVKTAKFQMFGDDTEENKPRIRKSYGWNRAGKQGEYVSGSIFCFSVTRAALIPVVQDIYNNHGNASAYIKAVLRKYIKTTSDEKEERAPDSAGIYDLFVLNDNRKDSAAKEKNRLKRETIISDNTPKADLGKADIPLTKTPVKTENKRKNPLLQYV